MDSSGVGRSSWGQGDGLYKVRGVAVEALVGAIYHEKGAQEASKVFHKLILPQLLQDGFQVPCQKSSSEALLFQSLLSHKSHPCAGPPDSNTNQNCKSFNATCTFTQ